MSEKPVEQRNMAELLEGYAPAPPPMNLRGYAFAGSILSAEQQEEVRQIVREEIARAAAPRS